MNDKERGSAQPAQAAAFSGNGGYSSGKPDTKMNFLNPASILEYHKQIIHEHNWEGCGEFIFQSELGPSVEGLAFVCAGLSTAH